jgi:hypothetical protein
MQRATARAYLMRCSKNLQKLKSLREQFLFLESEDSAEVADANKVGEAAPEHLVEETAPSEKPKKTKKKGRQKEKERSP